MLQAHGLHQWLLHMSRGLDDVMEKTNVLHDILVALRPFHRPGAGPPHQGAILPGHKSSALPRPSQTPIVPHRGGVAGMV